MLANICVEVLDLKKGEESNENSDDSDDEPIILDNNEINNNNNANAITNENFILRDPRYDYDIKVTTLGNNPKTILFLTWPEVLTPFILEMYSTFVSVRKK